MFGSSTFCLGCCEVFLFGESLEKVASLWVWTCFESLQVVVSVRASHVLENTTDTLKCFHGKISWKNVLGNPQPKAHKSMRTSAGTAAARESQLRLLLDRAWSHVQLLILGPWVAFQCSIVFPKWSKTSQRLQQKVSNRFLFLCMALVSCRFHDLLSGDQLFCEFHSAVRRCENLTWLFGPRGDEMSKTHLIGCGK